MAFAFGWAVQTYSHMGMYCFECRPASSYYNMQVSRHAPSICDRLPDLVDLLLGWTFDEHFPDAAKYAPSACQAAIRCKTYWWLCLGK